MYPEQSLQSDPKIVPVASVPVGRPIQAQSIGSEVVEVNGNLSVVTAVDAATNAVASHAGAGAHFSTKPARRFTLVKAIPQIESSEASLPYRGFKAAFDIVGASVLLLVAAPLMILIALVVKCSSRGPIIFRQSRLTEKGQQFTMYKFRTMRNDAEAKSGAVWARRNDPRVTSIGAFLRTTRMDELPQLVNVLKGDMSLIGPRPERPEFAEQIAQDVRGFHRRLGVKAGLTGLAQVGNGYSSSTNGHRKKLAWDRLYIQRRSVGLDLWILLRTIFVVVTGRGAR